MSEIQRREWNENEERYVECEDGHVVLYEDHVAVIEQWKTWGIIEIAVRNSNVMEYMKHWEGRALRAEAKNSYLETPKFDTSGVCELCEKEYTRVRRKQRYCSKKCQVAAAMRRFRAKEI
jgi:hypothetical protein